MGRFLLFLLVFVIGGIVGIIGGGVFGGAAGAYFGACKVIDTAVGGNTMTQEQANTLIKSIAADIDIRTTDKDRIITALKKTDQPPSPCVTAIQGL